MLFLFLFLQRLYEGALFVSKFSYTRDGILILGICQWREFWRQEEESTRVKETVLKKAIFILYYYLRSYMEQKGVSVCMQKERILSEIAKDRFLQWCKHVHYICSRRFLYNPVKLCPFVVLLKVVCYGNLPTLFRIYFLQDLGVLLQYNTGINLVFFRDVKTYATIPRPPGSFSLSISRFQGFILGNLILFFSFPF